MDKLYIVMPAYNEEANVQAVVQQWYPIVESIGCDSKLVIVDDGSKDKTFNILKELTETYPQLVALVKNNSGHGSTCLYAYRYAIENGADYIFQTDSDGQTDPEEFFEFWKQRAEYDFLIGAREDRQDGFSRVVVTKILKMVVMFIFGEVIVDANTPFRLMKASILNDLLKEVPKDFFLSNVMISVLAVSGKNKIKWIPITFKQRQGGINSINLKRIFAIGIKSIKDLSKVKRDLKRKKKA